jgi:hypothetical protein
MGDICQKIQIDQHLDKGMERQLWKVLYQDVFAWNKKGAWVLQHWRTSNRHTRVPTL